MPRRRYTKKETEFVMYVIVGIIIALVVLWNFLVETKLIWAIPVIAVGIVLIRWYSKKQDEKNRLLAEEKLALQRKQDEEMRVENILSHRSEWGEEMCQWLIDYGANINDDRVAQIMKQINEWEIELCQNLIQKKIDLGMNEQMVRFSLGEPTNVDNREISEKGTKFRWIYGIPRRGATYIWFKDSVVVKIRQ